MGQFEQIKDHMRGLRDVSEILNDGSGIVTHEVISEGSNWFGARLAPPERRLQLQHRRDGQVPERRRPDLALDGRRPLPSRPVRLLGPRHARRGRPARRGRRRLARGLRQRGARGDGRREARQLRLPDPRPLRPGRPGARRGRPRRRASGRPISPAGCTSGSRTPGGSRARPTGRSTPTRSTTRRVGGDNNKQQDKHWIGVTPMEAELTIGGMAVPGLATFDHGNQALALRETDCYSGSRPYNLGLFHTGCGGGSDRRRRADDLRPQHGDPGRRRGQLRPHRTGQRRYTDAEAEPMFGQPYTGGTPDEQPGSLPEILPSPDFDRRRPERRQHPAVLELPRDVRAGLGPLRHGVAGGPPAARRPARHGPREPRGRAAGAVDRADRGPRHPARQGRARPRRGVA